MLLVLGCGAKLPTTTADDASPVSNQSGRNVNQGVPAAANVAEHMNVASAPEAVAPVEGFFNRITKKPFGIYITPKRSPVQPERFTGYHAGSDAETTSDEQNVDVPVYSVAAGTVTRVSHVNGYGGVIMVQHKVGDETVTALYGHVRFATVSVKVGQQVEAGHKIAVLGKGYSTETDGERKHLHFALLKGASSVVKGYVTTNDALSPWYDPVLWLREHGAS